MRMCWVRMILFSSVYLKRTCFWDFSSLLRTVSFKSVLLGCAYSSTIKVFRFNTTVQRSWTMLGYFAEGSSYLNLWKFLSNFCNSVSNGLKLGPSSNNALIWDMSSNMQHSVPEVFGRENLYWLEGPPCSAIHSRSWVFILEQRCDLAKILSDSELVSLFHW